MSIRVEGLTELVSAFEAEVIHSPGRARRVVQTYSAKVKQSMRQDAPVDRGRMRDSITYETKQLAGGATGEIGPSATRDGFPYPQAVEWGTSRMPPQPFAGPALDRHAEDFVNDISQEASKL